MSTTKSSDKNIKSRGLFLLDLFFITLTTSITFFIAKLDVPLATIRTELIFNSLFITAFLVITNLAVGLYDAKLRDSPRGIARRIIVSIALCYFALELLIYSLNILDSDSLYHSYLPLVLLLNIFIIFKIRFLTLSSSILGHSKKRVLVIGAGERASIITTRMRRIVDRKNFELLGFYPIENDKPADLSGETILELDSHDDLMSFIEENEIDEIVIAPDERRGNLPVHILFECKIRGVEIVDILDFMEDETGQIAVNLIYPSWIIHNNGFKTTHHLKESFDYVLNILLALSIFIFTWPFMLITVIAIYLEDGKRTKSSVLYKQTRIGLDNKPFSIYKFRSMGPDAEKDGAQWAQKVDNRVTKVGAIIRKYRIDELPQLFNVFRGEMGFVGPRPERPEFVDQLKEVSPYYTYRHNVRPGLTGWAQLKYPYGASTDDSIEKLKFDLYYIKHRSIMLDLFILVSTVEIVLFGKGR